MPFAAVNGIQLFYRIDATAGSDAPWLVLSNSLGADVSMWTPQVETLAAKYRVLRYDTRGHGRSDAPKGPYTLSQLVGDVIGLLDALGVKRAHYCGLSMGGLTGIALAARHPERFERVVLVEYGGADRLGRNLDAAGRQSPRGGRHAGIGRRRSAALVHGWLHGRAAACACRAFVMCSVTPPAKVTHRIAKRSAMPMHAKKRRPSRRRCWLFRARMTSPRPLRKGANWPDISQTHVTSNSMPRTCRISSKRTFTRKRCLSSWVPDMTEDERYEAGLSVRREVLGDAHVTRSLENRTDLTTEFQNLITRYAWGDIWTRPGLPRHTRSLLTISMMVALNRSEELALHLRAAKNNGVTRDEIKEVLLQTAIYCGVPAANSAFHLAQKIFDEDDRAA